MIITWLGHSCFEIEGEHITVITDPYNDSVGYPMRSRGADFATVSHHHADHDETSWIIGCEVVSGLGKHDLSSATFLGIESFHDKKEGAIRGPNTIFKFEIDGIAFCHLGDLGHVIDEKTWRKIGNVDVLFVPIGGTYTIDAYDAKKVIDALDPHLSIAMQYRNTACNFPIDTQDEFMWLTKGTKMKESSIRFSFEELHKSSSIVSLEWKRV
ncbi:MAG: MBL fold metallo-hydrolase [Clostridiales bacterium]|nr:MBL fold metallo-hydrolase [Clostridiales bacterium]